VVVAELEQITAAAVGSGEMDLKGAISKSTSGRNPAHEKQMK
jgi:hypothetical protein